MSGKSTRVTTPVFTVSYPALFEAKTSFEGQPPSYHVTMMWHKDTDLSSMHEAIEQVAVKKWGKVPAKLQMPFRDGNEKLDDKGKVKPEYVDVIHARAKSMERPGVVDANVQQIMDPSEVYGGCKARASLNVYAWEFAGKKGVSFALNNLQKTGDGEAFGVSRTAEDDFDVV